MWLKKAKKSAMEEEKERIIMAIITILVTIGPMALISAVIELITRIPDWIREKQEDRMFRKTHTLFGKSTY